MRIIIINRKNKINRNSIEKVFSTIVSSIDLENVLIKEISLITWFYSLGAKLIHISGDVYWFAILLFWKKITLTYHDIGHYKSLYGIKKRIYLFFWIVIPIVIAKKVTAVSKKTKDDLEKLLGTLKLTKKFTRNKIIFIPNPLTITNHSLPFDKKNYFLIIGTRPNKRIDLCIKAASKTKIPVVIIGELESKYFGLLKKYNVNYRNYQNVSEQDLCLFYKESFCLLFLSDHEGFGLPIIEAQFLGVPVISNNLDVLKSTGGDAVIYVDNYDVDQIKNAVIKLKQNKFRTELIKRGIQNASKYDPSNISKYYLNLFYECIEN